MSNHPIKEPRLPLSPTYGTWLQHMDCLETIFEEGFAGRSAQSTYLPKLHQTVAVSEVPCMFKFTQLLYLGRSV